MIPMNTMTIIMATTIAVVGLGVGVDRPPPRLSGLTRMRNSPAISACQAKAQPCLSPPRMLGKAAGRTT